MMNGVPEEANPEKAKQNLMHTAMINNGRKVSRPGQPGPMQMQQGQPQNQAQAQAQLMALQSQAQRQAQAQQQAVFTLVRFTNFSAITKTLTVQVLRWVTLTVLINANALHPRMTKVRSLARYQTRANQQMGFL